MKKLNRGGFVLAETLIVTGFILILFIMVYQNLVPIMGEYEKMYTYDDVDSVYAANLFKKVITDYSNLDNIDLALQDNIYYDISDCSNSEIYTNTNYCAKIKEALNMTDDDVILITEYNIRGFRREVKNNVYFDSGVLSNFKSYVNTLSDVDSFYKQSENKDGKYRLFIARKVSSTDGTTKMKYANLGIFFEK